MYFVLLPRSNQSLSGSKFNFRSALRSAVFQCLDHIPKEDYKHAFEQWIQRPRKCVAYLEKMKAKKMFKMSERYFKSMVSFLAEYPHILE